MYLDYVILWWIEYQFHKLHQANAIGSEILAINKFLAMILSDEKYKQKIFQ